MVMSAEAGSDIGRKNSERDVLRESKVWLLQALARLGVEEEPSQLTVCRVRKSRPSRVGYYSHMSQFCGRARIVIDVESIRREMPTEPEAVIQVRMTCAHEYGHMVAEMLRWMKNESESFKELDARWKSAFDEDEEAFAEDLARELVRPEMASWMGWQAFMAEFGKELALKTSSDERL